MSNIALRGGLIVSDAAIDLALRIVDAGFVLTARDGVLDVSSSTGAKLSDVDRAEIRALKPHLLAIASYVPPEIEQ